MSSAMNRDREAHLHWCDYRKYGDIAACNCGLRTEADPSQAPGVQATLHSALQDWVMKLSLMMQSVLLTAIRGPDGLPKEHVSKVLLRWYRRCVLYSAFDRRVLTSPYEPGGGSFTGPCNFIDYPYEGSHYATRGLSAKDGMVLVLHRYLRSLDEVPHHFQLHFLHAAEILGYKHPDEEIRAWWFRTYLALVRDMHLNPETEEELDKRLGDNEEQWRESSALGE